jgi:hypothetical protein
MLSGLYMSTDFWVLLGGHTLFMLHLFKDSSQEILFASDCQYTFRHLNHVTCVVEICGTTHDGRRPVSGGSQTGKPGDVWISDMPRAQCELVGAQGLCG